MKRLRTLWYEKLLVLFELNLFLLKLKIKNKKYYNKIIFNYINNIIWLFLFFLNKMTVGS